jgi:PAS domain S-box-containing protein
MRKFIQRALEKIPKLDKEQVSHLVRDLATENERLEGVLDSLVSGIMVADAEHRLILTNKMAERLLPISTGDQDERPIWEAIRDQDISRFLQGVLQSQDKVSDKEFAIQTAGAPKLLRCNIIPLVREGMVQGNVFLAEDITERKSKEARLRRAESLAALTTLTAGVAHEIKNPLGSIGIHIQLIQRALRNGGDMDVDAVEHDLEVITEEVERLNRIVVDFLFAVRPMNVELEDQDLNRVLHELLQFMQYELEENSVRVVERYAEGLPKISLDERLMKQAILNVVKNAISAMPDGGELVVSTSVRGDEVVLRIRDTGTGIPDDLLDKIFEPYFTTKDFGSGLGLTLVYKIVKEHFGEISVSSKEGEGTTFELSFPIPQGQQRLLNWEGAAE